MSPALAGGFLTTAPPGKPLHVLPLHVGLISISSDTKAGVSANVSLLIEGDSAGAGSKGRWRLGAPMGGRCVCWGDEMAWKENGGGAGD